MKRATLLFFWDYDTQWGADRSRSAGGPKSWGRLEFENTERLLDLHAQYRVPACFAVVGAAALPGERPYHDPAQIRRIHEAGQEIASHSFRHEWLPSLDGPALRDTLSWSKDALEQCIGAPVVSFVPPYNQPFDYLAGLSLSLSERRQTNGDRVNLRRLCNELRETGYRFCRVAYHPIHHRLGELVLGRPLNRPSRLEEIAGIMCLRLNAPGGFDSGALERLSRCVEAGKIFAVYGHPHSLRSGNAQDEAWLVPFLQRVDHLRQRGLLEVQLPGRITRRMTCCE